MLLECRRFLLVQPSAGATECCIGCGVKRADLGGVKSVVKQRSGHSGGIAGHVGGAGLVSPAVPTNPGRRDTDTGADPALTSQTVDTMAVADLGDTGGDLRTFAAMTAAPKTAPSAAPAGETLNVNVANADTTPPTSAPTAAPTQQAPNQSTGAITGSINGSDMDGNTLSYTVTGAPANGTADLNLTTGAFTYTPTQAARFAAD